MEKYKVFMIMPFQDEFFEVYTMLKSRFADKYEFTNAGDEDNQQNILSDIIQPIYEADAIVADLTGLNPNVLYELGVAHTLNKKCIVITKDELDLLPFDLKQYRAKNYDTHFLKFDELIKYLEKNLDGAVKGTVAFTNPVSDFLVTASGNMLCSPQELMDKSTQDMGFLDYMAGIEEDADEMTKTLLLLTDDLNEMNQGIVNGTKKITSLSGKGKTLLIKIETKKIADIIVNFQVKLSEYNIALSDRWNRIECNILGLLENSFILNKEKIEELNTFFVSLNKLRSSVEASVGSIEVLKGAIIKNNGIERTLTQANKLLETELIVYLETMGQMIASVDRIDDKYKLLKIKFNG